MNELFYKQLREWFFQNLANIITLLGLLGAIWLLVVAINSPEQLWLIVLLAGLVGLSDLVDGIIARRFKIISTFGGALDRLRDKIFVVPTLIIFTWHQAWKITTFPIVTSTLVKALIIMIILIEALLFVAWWVGLFKKISVESNKWGKRKMFCEFLVVAFWLISLTVEKYAQFQVMKFSIYLIIITLVLTNYFAVRSLEGYYQRYENRNLN